MWVRNQKKKKGKEKDKGKERRRKEITIFWKGKGSGALGEYITIFSKIKDTECTCAGLFQEIFQRNC